MLSFELTIKYPISFWLTLVSMDTHSRPTVRRKVINILDIFFKKEKLSFKKKSATIWNYDDLL